MQSGVFFITQSSSDLLDEKIKNNIGLKFAFHSTDKTEIRNTLRFFGLDPDDEGNQNAIMSLETGECLMQDIYGRVGKVHTQILLQHVFDAFDTRLQEGRKFHEKEMGNENKKTAKAAQTDPVSISCMHASDRITFIGCQYGSICSFRAG